MVDRIGPAGLALVPGSPMTDQSDPASTGAGSPSTSLDRTIQISGADPVSP
jgi:hypothetical protein